MLRFIRKYVLAIVIIIIVVSMGIGACQINKSMAQQHRWGVNPSDGILE